MRSAGRFLILLLIVTVALGIYTFFTEAPLLRAGPDDEDTWNIGFVDIHAIFQAHPSKSKAEDQLAMEAMEMQEELERTVQDLSGEERMALIEDYQMQLVVREQELIQNVVEEMDHIIREVAAEHRVSVVMEQHNVIFGGVDLTGAVLNRIQEGSANRQLPTAKAEGLETP